MNGDSPQARTVVGRVGSVNNMVEYQPGSVVSRELLGVAAGTVTLFAFDRGQGLSEHTAPFDALVYIVDGEAEITLEGRNFQVRAGEMIIMPAGRPHGVKARERFKMLLIMIRS